MLEDKGLIRPPGFLADNVHYEVMMGSVAYGVSSDTSDVDVYGFCTPPKDVVFPHLTGEIQGFGRQKKRFDQYQQHHVPVHGKRGPEDTVYDLTIYNIVKYFSLCMENNPNMLDSLFVPQTCVLYINQIGNMVREKRHQFLHKGCWHKLKGYAYSQLHKMAGKKPVPGSNRAALREQYGFDVKFAYHVVRLLSQAEQILATGDLDLREKGRREHMKAVRRGEVPEEDIRKWASEKEKSLEKLYETSKLPYSPDESVIKQLLLDCLEHHYGSLENAIFVPDAADVALRQIHEIAYKALQRPS